MGRAIRPSATGGLRGDSDKERRPPSRLVWGSIGAAVTAILFLIFRVGADPPPPGQVLAVIPAHAIGTWETADPRYAGRLIFVMEDQVLLDRGPENDPGGGSLIEARAWVEGEDEIIRFEVLGPEGREMIEFVFEPAGLMHLRNPEEVIWTRLEPTNAPEARRRPARSASGERPRGERGFA